ncbi:serine/threonine-protein phosphatase 6 regulatory ankyrin repeat subunit B-like [Durio zibethinus]|uniref:Serine/threonine-protein phosphatase 6 regulatory ankyrin repeat subunit B-like n=1 Tax=Durio zibethinus TaxID=66656 RepID=A0A6P5ZCC1_DURZI|nr:serine/threonine-protein phosphatase 6 regulatory ankyrin repeat subunit B-like [Durio zibethinus]XP_022750498.1 serine/threonine-protein phosphatase 6 regulatory ankyrin repeat subunit B-like [Durio zibethinus]XP_022750499.1 serine/threonine-protein phosphatase 6 regulatory ankyrin repeat subunit B-like [Durio zibethinus]XP_022750500.1 serine/threonine-protein phosphatase 6 regulatory ankyrin repeat subunit B-like [Durio zibethinus]
MPPTYFPLRWESTGDQWWYASPIDWAAANGHYDLVRELLRVDGNHLIKLTSLRRIRRLETVWDDEEQFDDAAKCRSQVARKLYIECESKKAKNSLIKAGYGGWLIYTAASAGDLDFVRELLDRKPLLVFGEGEYGVTDILYAAARGKNSELFRLIYDFAVSPRFLTAKAEGSKEHIGDIPSVYKWEITNRAVHAAARGGNLKILKELLSDYTDILAYRDKRGSTVLHTAAGRGQVEVAKNLVESFDIINSVDDQGNTALHIAAYRGQAAVVDALILASPSLISARNKAGETFLHLAVSGFQTPAFRRVDRQINLMKQVVHAKNFNMEDIINAKNNDGKTALHLAIIGNVDTDLVELLMSAQSINVNIRDANGMTPLDLLRQRPRSASSDILIRHLISAGGMFGCQDDTARRAIASHLKMQGHGSSPGTSFRISDIEIFSSTGVETTSDASDVGSGGRSRSCSTDFGSADEYRKSSAGKKPGSTNNAAQRLKSVIHWPRLKEKKTERLKKSINEGCSEETPIPLRQRFSKPSSLPNNKRTLSVRSNQSTPIAKKKHASGMMHGVMQALPQLTIPGRSSSSSFSKSSFIGSDVAGPSCSNPSLDDEKPNTIVKQGSTKKGSRSQYFCFGGSSLAVKTPVSRQRQNQITVNPDMVSMA